MISEHQQEQASLYAVGALTAGEQQAFETELTANAELRDLVRGLQKTITQVACATPATLPAALKEKVMQRIDAVEAARRPASLPFGLRFLQGAAQSDWKPLPVPGTAIKLLSLERERGYAVLLGKLEPGARYPAHVNSGPEDFYILTGDLVVGDRKLVAGDFHHADRGSRHEENYSVEGCTLIAVLTTDDPLVAFAMS
ncbi:MAG: cupin domain-containing protein [Limisphaerales bacterium]